MAKYRNTGTPEFALRNERLIPWLDKNVPSGDWIIELTGGEPGMYNGINELVDWLSSHSYRTIIKTNGTLPIQPAHNVIRVAAFHKIDEPPKYFDKILIIDQLDRQEKEWICRKHWWDYRVIGYNDDALPGETHGFYAIGYMDPHGHPLPCKDTRVQFTKWPDKYALEYTGLRQNMCCIDCKAAIDCWKFIPDEWKR